MRLVDVIPFMKAAGSALPAGLIAWYKAENNLNDESGTYNASGSGSPAYAAGVVGNAFSFNATANARIVIPAMPSLVPPYTIECWMKVGTPVNGGVVFGHTPTGTTNFPTVRLTPGQTAPNGNGFGVIRNGVVAHDINGGGPIIPGVWYKTIWVFKSGGGIDLFVNGNYCYWSGTNSPFSYTWNSGLYLGGQATATAGTYFDGLIDDFKIYNISNPPATLPGNLIYDFEGDTLNSLSNDWVAHNASTPLYATDSNGNANGAFNFANSANNLRYLPYAHPGATWSVELSVRPDTGSGDGLVFHGGNGGSLFEGIAFQGGANNRALIRHNGSNMIIGSTNSLPANTWKTIKVTYDGSKMRLYIDGVLNGTEAGTHSAVWNQGRSSLGEAFFGTRYSGRIEKVRLYNAVV